MSGETEGQAWQSYGHPEGYDPRDDPYAEAEHLYDSPGLWTEEQKENRWQRFMAGQAEANAERVRRHAEADVRAKKNAELAALFEERRRAEREGRAVWRGPGSQDAASGRGTGTSRARTRVDPYSKRAES